MRLNQEMDKQQNTVTEAIREGLKPISYTIQVEVEFRADASSLRGFQWISSLQRSQQKKSKNPLLRGRFCHLCFQFLTETDCLLDALFT